MGNRRRQMVGAALAAGVLGVAPATGASHPTVAVSSVEAHTAAADVALKQATTLFANDRDAAAIRAFGRSRSQAARAGAEAMLIVRRAKTPARRVAAARALSVVAAARDERVPALVSLLGPADEAAERAIAKAALVDARGRERAARTLQSLLAVGVPTGAQVAIGRAIVALSTDRQAEVEVEADAAAGAAVSPRTARVLTTTIEVTLRGQARAGGTLAALRNRLPAAAAPGIDRAIAAIAAEQGAASAALAKLTPSMPDIVQERVEKVADRAAKAGGSTTPPLPVDAGVPEASSGQPADAPKVPLLG